MIAVKPTPVIIIDDDLNLRNSYVHVLSQSEDYQVFGEYTNVNEALKRINELQSAIILLDVHLNQDSSIDRINDIKRVNPYNKVVMLSNDCSAIVISNAFKKGADGYLLKSDAALSLGYHLSLLKKHDFIASPGSVNALIQFMKGQVGITEKTPEFLRALTNLTKAQKLVYEELLTGKTYEQIGELVGISKNTVAQHVQKIFRAFEVNSRSQLNGLVRSY